MGYSLWGRKEPDKTEHIHTICNKEKNLILHNKQLFQNFKLFHTYSISLNHCFPQFPIYFPGISFSEHFNTTVYTVHAQGVARHFYFEKILICSGSGQTLLL